MSTTSTFITVPEIQDWLLWLQQLRRRIYLAAWIVIVGSCGLREVL